MTNEEAIKVLLDEWKCIDRNDGINCDRQCEKCDLVMDSAILKDAYNMAIQALSQEPCPYSTKDGYCQYDDIAETIPTEQQPCDAISREDAEQMFRNIRSHLKPQDYKSAEEFNTRDLMLLNAEQMIHLLPPVTPQQKYGKWIRTPLLNCDRCHKINKSGEETDFCPNCGAKMQESEE